MVEFDSMVAGEKRLLIDSVISDFAEYSRIAFVLSFAPRYGLSVNQKCYLEKIESISQGEEKIDTTFQQWKVAVEQCLSNGMSEQLYQWCLDVLLPTFAPFSGGWYGIVHTLRSHRKLYSNWPLPIPLSEALAEWYVLDKKNRIRPTIDIANTIPVSSAAIAASVSGVDMSNVDGWFVDFRHALSAVLNDSIAINYLQHLVLTRNLSGYILSSPEISKAYASVAAEVNQQYIELVPEVITIHRSEIVIAI